MMNGHAGQQLNVPFHLGNAIDTERTGRLMSHGGPFQR